MEKNIIIPISFDDDINKLNIKSEKEFEKVFRPIIEQEKFAFVRRIESNVMKLQKEVKKIFPQCETYLNGEIMAMAITKECVLKKLKRILTLEEKMLKVRSDLLNDEITASPDWVPIDLAQSLENSKKLKDATYLQNHILDEKYNRTDTRFLIKEKKICLDPHSLISIIGEEMYLKESGNEKKMTYHKPSQKTLDTFGIPDLDDSEVVIFFNLKSVFGYQKIKDVSEEMYRATSILTSNSSQESKEQVIIRLRELGILP